MLSIVIFGYGAQGQPHALNLQASGMHVTVCLPTGSRRAKEVKAAGLPLTTNARDAARKAKIAAFMVPDSAQKNLYNEIEGSLPRNATIVFAHGLNIHYKLIKPRADLDVVLVSPMAHGNTVRQNYLDKKGTPTLIAVHQDATGSAWETTRAYAIGIGAKEETIIKTTFKEETETDLFSEQALICGGISHLIRAAFDTLVEEGYSPKVAYYCCLKEAWIMMDMFANFGIKGTFERVSDTARFGALTRGPRIIDSRVKNAMKKILKEIRSGKFIEDLNKEFKKPVGSASNKIMKELAKHKLEELHRQLNSHPHLTSPIPSTSLRAGKGEVG